MYFGMELLIVLGVTIIAAGLILCIDHYAKYGMIAHPPELYGWRDHGFIGLVLILAGLLVIEATLISFLFWGEAAG